MSELFVFTTIASIIMGVFMLSGGDPWWVGIAAFLWLCGGNWIIIFIRHETVATSIAAGIDELICGKIIQPEQDKMTAELKSWF